VTVTDSSQLTASSSVAVKVTGIPPVVDPTWCVADAGLGIANGQKPTVGGDRRFSGAPSA